MSDQTPIRAAGVVLLRDHDGQQQFLVVHRPGREDWSLPKGKLTSGEHVVTAAVRECDEESGYTPLLQAALPMQSYSVSSRPKVVNYWRARIRSDEGFAPDDEVDQIRWVPSDEASGLLTYPSEVRLVDHAIAMPDTTPLVILRHTQAMKRAQFDGTDDAERPLTGKGRSQSRSLIPLLDAFGVATVHASSARRCTETVQRFAKHLGVDVQPEPLLTEEGHEADPRDAAARAIELAMSPEPLVLCTHRPVLPTILDSMAVALGVSLEDPRWIRAWNPKLPPGGFIVVHRAFSDEGQVRVIGLEEHTLTD
jgi:phosphohistidine phosphatase SixA/8-oxo-dGTP pyrophosphatase MutT (NUDIX family)